MKLSNIDGTVIYSPTKLEIKKQKYAIDSQIFEARFSRKAQTAISLIAVTALSAALMPTAIYA